MAIIVKADGTKVLNVEPANGKRFELDQLQKIVGGYIQIISVDSPEASGSRYEIMIDKFISLDNKEAIAEHTSKFGGFNVLPPNFEPITQAEFARSHFFVYSPYCTEYRQVTIIARNADITKRLIRVINFNIIGFRRESACITEVYFKDGQWLRICWPTGVVLSTSL